MHVVCNADDMTDRDIPSGCHSIIICKGDYDYEIIGFIMMHLIWMEEPIRVSLANVIFAKRGKTYFGICFVSLLKIAFLYHFSRNHKEMLSLIRKQSRYEISNQRNAVLIKESI